MALWEQAPQGGVVQVLGLEARRAQCELARPRDPKSLKELLVSQSQTMEMSHHDSLPTS